MSRSERASATAAGLRRAVRRAAAVLVALVLAGATANADDARPQPPDRPERIVSLNVCTDQLLMLLVAPERIAAVTELAADPRVSALAAQAEGLPAIHGTAEETVALEPDLVLAGTYTTRPTVALLRRLGYRVVDVAPETSLADIRTNIAAVGEAVGEPARADALIDDFDAALAQARAPEERRSRPVFADIQPNGWVSGGGTLVADIAHAAGFDTLGERLGYQGVRQVSLEQLLVSKPDVLAIADAWDGGPSLATERLHHPALERLALARAEVGVPDPLWACGGPFTIEAVRRIAAARDSASAPAAAPEASP